MTMALLAAEPIPAPKLDIRHLDVNTVGVSPARFQFKGNVNPETGASTKLAGGIKYDPLLGGVLYAWEDLAGKVWIVNGHHRLDLARRSGYPTISAIVDREADGVTEADARSRGALINIAEGQGTPIDVAKFLRDSGQTVEWLRSRDIAPSNKLVERGAALAQLDDGLFYKVITGQLTEDAGVVIGAGLPGDHANQRAVANLVSGTTKELTPRELKALIQEAKGQTVKVQQINLFGETTEEKSTMIARAKVRAWIEDELAQDKKLFRFVTKAGRPEQLARGETVVNIEKGQELARQSGTALEIFNAKVNAVGPINDIVRDAAEEVVKGGNERTARENALRQIRDAISTGIALGDGSGTNRVGAEASASGISTEAAPAASNPDELATGEAQSPWRLSQAAFMASPPEGFRYNPNLSGEARYHYKGYIEVGPKFFDLTAGQRRHVIWHERGHADLDNAMLADPAVWEAVDAGAFGPKRPDGMIDGINGQLTPGENIAEAYALLITDPAWLREHHPKAAELVASWAAKLNMPTAELKSVAPESARPAFVGKTWYRGHAEGQPFGQTETFVASTREQAEPFASQVGGIVSEVTFKREPRVYGAAIPWDEYQQHWRNSALLAGYDVVPIMEPNGQATSYAVRNPEVMEVVPTARPKIYRGRQIGTAATGAEWWTENEAFARAFADELRGRKPGAGTATGEVVEDILPTGDIRDIDMEVGSHARLSQLAPRLGVSESDLRAAVGGDPLGDVLAQGDDPIRVHVILEMPSVQKMLSAKGIVAVKAREISDKDGSTVATFLRLDRPTVQSPAADAPVEIAVEPIPYRSDLDVRNVDQLSGGTGARYLIALRGQGDEYVASRWARRLPRSLETGEVVIDFKAPAEPTSLQGEYRKLKTALSRAQKAGPEATKAEVTRAMALFEKLGYPDDWHRWERAREDAELAERRERISQFEIHHPVGPIVQAGFGGDMGPGQVARGDAERAPMAQAPLTEIAVSEGDRIAQARQGEKYPDGRTIPQVGDKVVSVSGGFGGGAQFNEGVVEKNRRGELVVRISHITGFIGGKTPVKHRPFPLTPAWTKEGEETPYARSRREAEEQSKRWEQEAREDTANRERDTAAIVARSIAAGDTPYTEANVKPGMIVRVAFPPSDTELGIVTEIEHFKTGPETFIFTASDLERMQFTDDTPPEQIAATREIGAQLKAGKFPSLELITKADLKGGGGISAEALTVPSVPEHVPTHPVRSVDLKVGERFQEGDKWLTVTAVRPVDPNFPDRYSVVTDDGVRELGQNKIVRVRADLAPVEIPQIERTVNGRYRIVNDPETGHANEHTSIAAAEKILQKHGITKYRLPDGALVGGSEPSALEQPVKAWDGKQPWQMTKAEYLAAAERRLGGPFLPPGSGWGTEAEFKVQAAVAHRGFVETAIAEGKPVPSAIMAEYPDLTSVATSTEGATKQPWQMTPKEPWQMTRAEFQIAEYTPMVEAIQKAITAGKPIALRTQYRITPLRKPEHIYVDKRGDVRIPSGRKSVALLDDQVRSLAAQAGMSTPTFEDRVYHHAAVEEAVAAGKPVPAEVLRDYPDIAPAILETSKQREARIFKETEAKFAEEAASTETISEREARRAATAVTVTGPRLPLNAREIESVGKSARLSEEVAARLEVFKAAERDFRGSRRAIEPRRKIRLD